MLDEVSNRDDQQKRIPAWVYVVCVLGPLVLLVGIFLPPYIFGPPSALESRAKGTLCSYGQTQYAYLEESRTAGFGTFEELKEADRIAWGYTRSNMVEGFSLWTSVGYNSERANFQEGLANTFTIVAFPHSEKYVRYLHTFAIREDEVLREYNPDLEGAKTWGEDGDFGCRTWEPIR